MFYGWMDGWDWGGMHAEVRTCEGLLPLPAHAVAVQDAGVGVGVEGDPGGAHVVCPGTVDERMDGCSGFCDGEEQRHGDARTKEKGGDGFPLPMARAGGGGHDVVPGVEADPVGAAEPEDFEGAHQLCVAVVDLVLFGSKWRGYVCVWG